MKKLVLSFLTCILFSSLTFALEDVLLISINKTIPPDEINNALADLEKIDRSQSSDHFTAHLDEYITNDNTSNETLYYGIAVVIINYVNALTSKEQYLTFIREDNRFTLLSDTPLGPNPHPTVTGNN